MKVLVALIKVTILDYTENTEKLHRLGGGGKRLTD